MKLLKHILLTIIMLSFSELYSQNVQKILFCLENKEQKQFTQDNGLQNVYLIFQREFVNSDGITFNKKLMQESFDADIPNKDEVGFGVLDWEGSIYNALAGWVTVSNATYQKYLSQFISALRYAKILRPNIKWSYYSMPPKPYTQYIARPESYLDKRLPLIIEEDFIAPSIYIDYDGKTLDEVFIDQFADTNLKYSLEVGKKLNKLVYPFVWQRWHPNSLTNGNLLMPFTIWTEYITKIINTQNFGRRVDGIIWWNCVTYLYSIRVGDPVLDAEFANVTDIYAYQRTMFQSYLDCIKPLFNYYW